MAILYKILDMSSRSHFIQNSLVSFRPRLLTFFHLFAPTCSSPKKPTWNEQVDISRSIKYPIGRSCFVYLTCSISTCWTVLAAEINVPPGLFDVLALTAII